MWFDRESGARPWPARLLAASLLGWGAVGLVTMLRWRGFLWFAVPAIAPCILLPRPLVYIRLRAILLAFGAVIAFLVVQALAPSSEFQPQMLGRLDVVCPILLSLGAVSSLHAFTLRNSLLIVGTSYGLMVLSGLAGMALGDDYTRFSLMNAGYMACLVAFLHQLRTRRKVETAGRHYRGVQAALVGLSLALCYMLLPPVRDGAFALYGRLVSASVLVLREAVGLQASRFLDLRQPVPKDFSQRSAVVMRVESPALPGYLRGNCYDTYRNGRWERGEALERLPARPGPGTLTTFVLSRGGASPVEVRRLDTHVYLTPRFSSHVLYLPAGTDRVAAPVDTLRRDLNDTVLPGDDDAGDCDTYTASGSGNGATVSDPTAAATPPVECLAVPSNLRDALDEIAAGVFAEVTEGSSREKLAALSRFFGKNFRYELGISTPRSADPVLQFLQDTRRGHCSLFAAGTALLLRTQGIPARIVSGFVCAEQHPGGRYWLARENTAHAWTEAFVKEEGRWILVDNTPEDGRPMSEQGFSGTSAWLDWLRFRRQRLAALLRQMPFRDMVALAAGRLASLVEGTFAHPARATVTAAGLAALAFWRWRRRRRPVQLEGAAQVSAGCRRELDALLRTLGVRREPGETVRAAVTHPRALANPCRAAVLEAVTRYEAIRYGSCGADPAGVRGLESDLRGLRQRLRRHRSEANPSRDIA